MRRCSLLFALAVLAACSETPTARNANKDGGGGNNPPDFGGGTGDGGASTTKNCKETRPTALSEAQGTIAAEFAKTYSAYDLGPIPTPDPEEPTELDPLSGCTISPTDPNELLFVGRSETVSAALYKIKIKRDECTHIVGFEGRAELVKAVGNADANLVFKGEQLYVSQYPIGSIAQLDSSFTLVRSTNLATFGVDAPVTKNGDDFEAGESPGGIAFVPTYLGKSGQLRAVMYPSGNWFHITQDPDGTITGATKSVTLDHGPGAITYVPPDSPGFTKPSVILPEWFRGRFNLEESKRLTPDEQRVAVYEVDDDGDPVLSTRREFFTRIDAPWGAYFDRVSGDFLFLSWNKRPDRVIAVRGFPPPPPGPK